MAYKIPTFNLECNVWHGDPAVPPAGAPDIAGLVCQLTYGHPLAVVTAAPAGIRLVMLLRVPAGSDLRGLTSPTSQDCVEVPAGSGRFYVVWGVDDVGKGFENEYRQGVIVSTAQPAPLP